MTRPPLPPTVCQPLVSASWVGRCGSGIRLPHTYAYHWCAPSRAAFFTGRYVAMHGYEDGGDGPDKGEDGMGTGTSSAVRGGPASISPAWTSSNLKTACRCRCTSASCRRCSRAPATGPS